MAMKIVVDTSVVIKAFATEDINNKWRRFLQEFATQNPPLERELCFDLPPHRIYQDYKQALKLVPFSNAEMEFDNWYDSLPDMVISAQNGRIEKFDQNRRSELRNLNCEKDSEIAFIARTNHNQEDEGRVLVVEPCDSMSYRNTFIRPKVANYLGKMGITILLVEDVYKEIEGFLKKRENIVDLPSHTSNSERRVQAYTFLKTYFDLHDLRELCFCMGIDSEELKGSKKKELAMELIAYCERRELVEDLLSNCRDLRPNPSWPDLWEYGPV